MKWHRRDRPELIGGLMWARGKRCKASSSATDCELSLCFQLPSFHFASFHHSQRDVTDQTLKWTTRSACITVIIFISIEFNSWRLCFSSILLPPHLFFVTKNMSKRSAGTREWVVAAVAFRARSESPSSHSHKSPLAGTHDRKWNYYYCYGQHQRALQGEGARGVYGPMVCSLSSHWDWKCCGTSKALQATLNTPLTRNMIHQDKAVGRWQAWRKEHSPWMKPVWASGRARQLSRDIVLLAAQ